ncbi:hypothetical protein [Xenorhabdus bovienii]|uniref:Putative bacteriophage protein n=1 Tax=Xenorhabdus bovienii str. kraussei Becker Underwood TaxID=1398204 RepID=A0A077PPD5_XENBV|nr:hypothetical protein [Xenorhabdus bovienii]CDH22646.1 putative bacteriophage protein [Xenorhabdus bovienii str. kraussei Becker Underwood]
MANAFDFELHADENATKALAEIEARIKALEPALNSAREGLRFGGSETLENTGALGNKLRDMSQSAKDNVQNISDMIPPLKNFGELFTKYSSMASKGGLVGAVSGAIGYGMSKGYQTLRDMGKDAYNLDVLSKNTAMSIKDSSSLIGAMVQIGTEADQAKDSVQNLFNTLNAAERGENGSARAELDKLGVKIHTTKNGSADVIPTLLELEEAFRNKNIPSETENRLIVKLGLTPEILALLREGKIQERLDKAKKYGQTRTEEENKKLVDFDASANEFGARVDGLWNRAKIAGASWMLEESPEMKSVKDYKMRSKDTIDSFYHGNKSEDIRHIALGDDEFKKQLTFKERLSLTINKPDEGLQKKLDDKYSELWETQKKEHEAKSKAKEIPQLPKYEEPNYPNPLKSTGKKPRGIRNNNPGNLVAAPNAVGKDYGKTHTYVKFGTAHDGISAMARQIMLDAERGLNTIYSLLNKYASKKAGNNTSGYIDRVSKQTGYGPNQPINMHDPKELKKVMGAMIVVENDLNPYSDEQMNAGINDAIHDDRWSGLRKPHILREQRQQYGSNGQNQQFPSLYSNRQDAESEAEIAKGMAKVFQEAIRDKLQVEITLVNDKTGERQKFQSKSSGKVTTSMQYP